MSKINEYPQAVTINNNDLFVIDQESGGDHATKSASVSQIADKATSGVQSQIGDLSQLTTSVTSSLVGAMNEVNAKIDFDAASGTVNINANNYADPVVTVPVKTGYTCRGVIGLYVGNTNIAVNAYYMTDSNTKVKVVLRNVTSTTQSGVDFTAVLLYVRN